MHFSVAKLLSIAVMTYSHVSHLQNLHVHPANLLRIRRINLNFSVRPQHVRIATPPSFDVFFLENLCKDPHKLYIAGN